MFFGPRRVSTVKPTALLMSPHRPSGLHLAGVASISTRVHCKRLILDWTAALATYSWLAKAGNTLFECIAAYTVTRREFPRTASFHAIAGAQFFPWAESQSGLCYIPSWFSEFSVFTEFAEWVQKAWISLWQVKLPK